METRPIKDNEKYLISIDGNSILNTESMEYITISDQKKDGKITGYKYAALLNGADYYIKRIAVHRLVLVAFKGYDADKPWVNHKDGNRSNNHLDNLEWTTISENIQHSFDVLGRVAPSGDSHWSTGKTASKETKQLMSSSKIGKRHPKYKGFYLIEGKKYYSSYEAAQATGLNQRTLQRKCALNKDGFNFVLDPLKQF